jgi:hypothetical protein
MNQHENCARSFYTRRTAVSCPLNTGETISLPYARGWHAARVGAERGWNDRTVAMVLYCNIGLYGNTHWNIWLGLAKGFRPSRVISDQNEIEVMMMVIMMRRKIFVEETYIHRCKCESGANLICPDQHSCLLCNFDRKLYVF